MKHARNLVIYGGLLILPFIIGGIGGAATASSVTSWYQTLNKPFFNPPNWIFGPVWSLLYLLMGIASILMYRQENGFNLKTAGWYGGQLILNLGWSLIFFGLQLPAVALIEIIGLWITIYFTIKFFSLYSKTAGRLLYPYLAWVTFAALLNAAIVFLN